MLTTIIYSSPGSLIPVLFIPGSKICSIFRVDIGIGMFQFLGWLFMKKIDVPL
jgi:hypothetical protein